MALVSGTKPTKKTNAADTWSRYPGTRVRRRNQLGFFIFVQKTKGKGEIQKAETRFRSGDMNFVSVRRGGKKREDGGDIGVLCPEKT
jgi:hypothetical protein